MENVVNSYGVQLSYSILCHQHPFGMLIPGREYNSDYYRYGSGSQEKSDEISGSGNHNTAKFWEYDTRLGRRWNVDPKASLYPGQSPFSAFDNNPIQKNDPDGSSGIVTIDKNTCTVTVTATYTLYGNGASAALATQTAASIQKQWNDAKGTTTIDGKVYDVKFVIKGDYAPQTGNALENHIKDNKDYSQNYVKVVTSGIMASKTDGKGNTGTWLSPEVEGQNSTTASHEAGHGWGLPDAEIDQRGVGQPGIMAAKATGVDKGFAYDPKNASQVKTTDADGNATSFTNSVDPTKRKVTQANIDGLHLDKLDYDKKSGKANIGNLTNEYHP